MKYTSKGIIIHEDMNTDDFFINNYEGIKSFIGDEIFYSLDNECIKLYDKFRDILFDDINEYYTELEMLPQLITDGGIDSDCGVDRITFNKFIEHCSNEKYNKYLFLFDCNSLIGCLQSRIINSKDLFEQFYLKFCEFEIINKVNKDGVFWTSGGEANLVFSILNEIFTTTYAIMDLLTKISVQIERMPKSYEKYPKLVSLNTTYGDKKLIKNIDKSETIFSKKKEIKTIISLRNELIHNGTWENNPKIFFIKEDSKIIEKFILQPDITEEGTLVKSKNRKRFFSQNIKINENISNILFPFWESLLLTIKKINETTYR